MSGQLSLMAAPVVALEVSPTPEVLLHGASARGDNGEQLAPHRHVPPLPRKVHDESEWLRILDCADDVLRYDQAPRASLDLSVGRRAQSQGGRGVPGEKSLEYDTRGVRSYRYEAGERTDVEEATWPQLVSALSEQRDVEPEVARARDLAEAYHFLDYYGRVYARFEDEPGGNDWRPEPLVERLAEETVQLGGDPTLLEPHTDYMSAGVAAALSSTND